MLLSLLLLLFWCGVTTVVSHNLISQRPSRPSYVRASPRVDQCGLLVGLAEIGTLGINTTIMGVQSLQIRLQAIVEGMSLA